MILDVQDTELKNGVRVISSRNPYVQSAAMGIWVGVGGRYEPGDLSGISHFIEHLLFKGTEKLSSREITQAIEGRGGYVNAFTQEESTCYYGRISYDQLPPVMEVLTEMFLNPRFDSEDIDKERGVILEELMMYHDQPQQHVHDMLGQVMWKNHPLGRPLIGSPTTLDHITRDELIRFKSSRYVPGRTVFTFAGHVDHDACVDQVEKMAGGMRRRQNPDCQPVDSDVSQDMISLESRKIEQAHLAMGFRTFGTHSRSRHTLRIMSALLGENMSSRLFQVVREDHALAYSINSSACLYEDTGAFLISAGLDRDHLPKALQLIVKELTTIKENAVDKEELRRAKDYVIGQIRLGLESTTQQVMWLGETVLAHGRLVTPEETIDSLEKVSVEDISKLARQVLRARNVSMSVIGPDLTDEDRDQLQEIVNALD